MKAPLKSVLKNFLDHVENLETRRKLSDDQYEIEFQELKKLTDKLKEDSAYQCSCGLKDVNRPKNRYKDIVPYDFSRVILPKHEGIPGSDYINASYVKGASGALAYIAAQGPLPNTVIDFWRMIWICDVQVVVMACNETEAGKFKCEAYWPVPGETRQYGNVSIELVKTSQVCPDFLVRTLLVSCGSEVRDVYQFHYTTWPDHGVPDSVQPILDLVRLMRDCQASETVPIVVHCSAGCGRTGTICAVDYVWACLRHGKLDEDFSLYQIALELRRQRIAMIQTKEQYILAHKAVAAMFEQQLRVIDCHIYENLDEDGEPLIWKEVQKGKELDVPSFMKKVDTKEEAEFRTTDENKPPIDGKNNSTEKPQASNIDIISQNSSVDNNLSTKTNLLDCVNNSSKNSESSYSRNSILSQHSNEDSIPFIDEDDVCIRPNCGRAYLDIPSCDSISKLANSFDPFVDKLSLCTDDSSPDGDINEISNKMKDFQVASYSKTLDKNAKLSIFKDKYTEVQEAKRSSNASDIIDSAKKSLLLNNRDSYPPCSSNEKFQKSSKETVEGGINEASEDLQNGKKIGKATVVRRPSISKLKALFEKSGVSSQNRSSEGSKRLLFRNNSHHVSRAGSAPPSLDCMDKSSAVERESILKLVTRKFRSSSVRTERELQSKQLEKTLNRRSAAETVKEGFNTLTRTVSFNINKTFKSYSPAKMKPENNNKSSASSPTESIVGIYTPKSPDHQSKGNSMWYDKSSLPRAVAVVKPTGKFETRNNSKPVIGPPDSKSPDTFTKTQETHFNYLTKPAKLKDFFSSLNKKDAKDPTTFWYNESNIEPSLDVEKDNSDFPSKNDNSTTKSTRVLPFLPIVPWKKAGQKSPLSSPDSPKNFNESTVPQKSTFYTNVLEVDSTEVSTAVDMVKCPVPEEIIPLNSNSMKSSFWPSNSVSSSSQSTNSFKSDSSVSEEKRDAHKKYENTELATNEFKIKIGGDVPEQSVTTEYGKSESDFSTSKEVLSEQFDISEISKNESNALSKQDSTQNSVVAEFPKKENSMKASDMRPAIPKKMVIGKNKNFQNNTVDKVNDSQNIPLNQITTDSILKSNTETNQPSEQSMKNDTIVEKSDLYTNVNIKALKNIEQIEKTLRKNPRGAIIDLTSRESYSMEEELVKAVNQLSEPSSKTNVPSITPTEHLEKNKISGTKTNSKFPGYEVIWPEQPHVTIQKSMSSSKVPLTSKPKLMDKKAEIIFSNRNKTGLCYSPPLRRSVNTNMALAKSQSCGNLWSELDDSASCLKERSNTPTKKLVNEAVVELNTLLNQLTTRTLSEDVDINVKSKEKPVVSTENKKQADESLRNSGVEANDTVVHSVTLVTKSYNSGSSPKEEEIVFHFPPPPRMPPPPKDDSPVESFNIVCKDGSLIVEESKNNNANCANGKDSVSTNSSTSSSDSLLEDNSLHRIPQPMPRKSKQTNALRRSSSYTNISPPQNKNKGYENVFLEKYQTLSRLQIKPEFEESNVLDKVVPTHKSPLMSRSFNPKMPANYVNVGDLNNQHNSIIFPRAPENIKGEAIFQPVNDSNQIFHNKLKMMGNDRNNGDSIYGKICKVSDKKIILTEKSGDAESPHAIKTVEVKKKTTHSKKTERAPLPPNLKPVQIIDPEVSSKISPNISMIPKKLPSRKLEKAPPPPLIEKSSSTANVPSKKNLQGPPSYVNFPPTHQVEDRSKLPAVHENVPNITGTAQVTNKSSINTSVIHDKFVSRGLSHSQSDVSVYLALKEKRMQSANQERKILNMKSLLMNKRIKTDALNVSSSDSDSSYEKIFFTKKDEPIKTAPTNTPNEPIEQISVKSYKKEVPIAPPRSKRRSTTEVQYSKVKAKDASHISSTSYMLREAALKNSKTNSTASEDEPPAIPVKTKDAFEIPYEDLNKKTNKMNVSRPAK